MLIQSDRHRQFSVVHTTRYVHHMIHTLLHDHNVGAELSKYALPVTCTTYVHILNQLETDVYTDLYIWL